MTAFNSPELLFARLMDEKPLLTSPQLSGSRSIKHHQTLVCPCTPCKRIRLRVGVHGAITAINGIKVQYRPKYRRKVKRYCQGLTESWMQKAEVNEQLRFREAAVMGGMVKQIQGWLHAA